MEKARPFLVGLVALVVLFAAYFAMKRPNDREYEDPASASTSWAAENAGDPLGTPSRATEKQGEAAAPTRKKLDPLARAELKKKIYGALWTESGRSPSPSEREQVPPSTAKLSPEYIQSRIREDFKPMATKCYEELLSRTPDAGGTAVMEFTIVADEKLGGIVEETVLGDAGTLVDPAFSTCMRESLGTVAFNPPPKGGKTTVHYPFSFSPGPDEPAPKN